MNANEAKKLSISASKVDIDLFMKQIEVAANDKQVSIIVEKMPGVIKLYLEHQGFIVKTLANKLFEITWT